MTCLAISRNAHHYSDIMINAYVTVDSCENGHIEMSFSVHAISKKNSLFSFTRPKHI